MNFIFKNKHIIVSNDMSKGLLKDNEKMIKIKTDWWFKWSNEY